MPLYAGELNIRRGAPLAEYPAPLSEVLRAQGEETRLHNPLEALRRLSDLREAEEGQILPQPGTVDFEMEPVTRAPVTRIDAETARAKVKEAGLKLTIPDDGISERALDILMRRKLDEMRRQDIFSRGPSGIGAGAARLGVAFYESLFDPLNVASAFIPVVGPARYATMLARASSPLARAGIRAQVGALEGAVGAALLEPLVYSAAQAEQLDYTMYDSLANVAFGGIFGGGLHAGGGALADALRRPSVLRQAPETEIQPREIAPDRETARDVATAADFDARYAAMRASVVQAVEGRPTEIAPIFQPARTPTVAEDVAAVARAMRSEIGFEERGGRVIFDEAGRDTAPGGGDVIGRTVWIGQRWWFDRPDKGLDSRRAKAAIDKWQEGKRLGAREQRFIDYVQEEARHRLEAERMDDLPDVVRDIEAEGLDPVAKNAVDADLVARASEIDEVGVERAAIKYENDDAAFMAEIRRILNEQSQETTGGSQANRAAAQAAPGAQEGLTPALDNARAAAQRSAVSVRSADPDASRLAAEQAKAKPADLKSAEEQFDTSVATAEEVAGALGVDVRSELKAHAEAIARTEQYEKALKAGAACGIA